MPDVEEIVNGLEMSYKYSNVDANNTLVPQRIVLHVIELLKKYEPVEPIRQWGDDETTWWYSCGKLPKKVV